MAGQNMALESGRSGIAGAPDWKNLDQLFCDLIQDPLISALINNPAHAQSGSVDAPSTLTGYQEADNGSSNWRPWSPVTPEPEGSCTAGGDSFQSTYPSGNLFTELAKVRPTSLCSSGASTTNYPTQVPQDPRTRPAATPSPSPVSTPVTATPSPTTQLTHDHQHPYLNDPRLINKRPSTMSLPQTHSSESSPQTPTSTPVPYQNGYHQQPPSNYFLVPTLNHYDQYRGSGTLSNIGTNGWSPIATTPSPQTPPAWDPPSSSLSPPDCDFSQLVDIEVVLKANSKDMQFYGRLGVVRRINANQIVNVSIYDTHQEVSLPFRCLQVVCPQQFDTVKVISGVNKGSLGRLMTVTNSTGIVQLFAYGGQAVQNLIQFNLKHLGRYKPQGNSHIVSRGGVSGNGYLQSPISSSPFVFNSRFYQCQTGYPPYHPQNAIHNQGRNGYWSSNGSNRRFAQQPPPYNQVKPPNQPMKTDSFLKASKLLPQRVSSGDRAVSVKSTEEILEALLMKQSSRYDYSGTEEGTEVKTSCVRVSLVCPLSQRRMEYPSRGIHCKHPQCFDAEAYLEFNRTQKARSKAKNGVLNRAVADRRWNCPLCHKVTPYTHLYLDRTLMMVVKETSVTEVEFDQSGKWKPVERREAPKQDVIDLTLDDSDTES